MRMRRRIIQKTSVKLNHSLVVVADDDNITSLVVLLFCFGFNSLGYSGCCTVHDGLFEIMGESALKKKKKKTRRVVVVVAS